MEGFILELSLDITQLDAAIEEFEQHEDILNDVFLACQHDRMIHAKDALVEVRDALKQCLTDD